MKPLVTRESLLKILASEKQKLVIGRALVALFNRQIPSEQSNNTTTHHNGIGFTPSDARSGTITAKYFLKHKALLDWQAEKWMTPSATGFPRIVKYVRQLNEVANEKTN